MRIKTFIKTTLPIISGAQINDPQTTHFTGSNLEPEKVRKSQSKMENNRGAKSLSFTDNTFHVMQKPTKFTIFKK